MKTYEEMAQSALARIESHQIEKRKRRKTAALISLPVACVCLAAVLGVFAWRSGAAGAPVTDGGIVALNDGAGILSKPADELPEPTEPKALSDAPDEGAINAPAKSSDATPEKPSDTSPTKPADPAPVKPIDMPAEPKDETPPAPEETPPGQPDEEVPEPAEEEPPVKPEEEPSAEPSVGTEDPSEEPEPPQDTTPQEELQPYRPPEIGAAYRMDGDRELITLTLLSTGEVEEFDVTGWRGQSYARPSGEQPGQVEAQSSSAYAKQCSAFGVIVMCFLSVDENNEVHVNTVTITLRQNDPPTPEEAEKARAAKEAAEAAARAAQEGSITS